MDASEYDLKFFHREGFHRRVCRTCGHAFWTLGDATECAEDPCSPYSFIGHPGFRRPLDASEMRETFLRFFEARGHQRIRRYPTVARWRNDVFFTQASIYDFQPWVTSGAVPPPANPLTISQPCVRFLDIAEVGRSGRHFTMFEMMAHHAFNRPDHEIYFKERCAELCHEFVVSELGADARRLTYKEEEWEGGGNLGPSLSVGLMGLELATLVFMEYTRENGELKPMPLTVVDPGYGLERLTWMSKGTKTAYEAVFGEPYDELRRAFSPADSAILVDHARALNFVLTDGIVPSNAKAGYFARLSLRRMLRVLSNASEAPPLTAVLDRVGREIARDYPEIGANREDLHRVVEAEVERYQEAIERARSVIRRQEERVMKEGGRITEADLLTWYDSLGVPPEVATAELQRPPPIPANFFAQVAERHEHDRPETDYTEGTHGAPEVDPTVPETRVEYFLDPYTLTFEGRVLWAEGPWAVLDRTYFYPTGGGQISDTGTLADVPVVDVLRSVHWVLHRLDRPAPFRAGERVRGKIDVGRRRQLMQHHTATHLLNGALRETLGPHIWQAGAHKGLESARIDITHYRPLSPDELRRVERRVNELVRENRPVKSYFELRTEAERRFGFSLYQGGAVPGRELRIVEIEGFDVEACGGTHCTRTSEVGAVVLLGTERIQDGVIRLSYAAGERGVEVVHQFHEWLTDSGRKLGVPIEQVPKAIDHLMSQLETARRGARHVTRQDLSDLSERLLADPNHTLSKGDLTVVIAEESLDRAGLMELSRQLTKVPGRVAVLTSTKEGRGTLFIGSSDAHSPAAPILHAVLPLFQGRGGGDPSAATGVGEPGEPLREAAAEARRLAFERGRSGAST